LRSIKADLAKMNQQSVYDRIQQKQMLVLEQVEQDRKWIQHRIAVATLADQKAVESARKMAQDTYLEN